MSVEAIKTVSPQFNFSERVVYPFVAQPESTTYKTYVADSVSNSNINISLNTPGLQNNVLSRNAFRECTLRLSYQVIAPVGQYSHQSSHVCPRRFPLANTCSNESVQINNFTNTVNLAQVVDALTSHLSFEDYNSLVYESITQRDPTQAYNADLQLSANSPFASSADTRQELMPRNSWGYRTVANPLGDGVTAQTVTLEYTFYEPIFTPPFQMGLNLENKDFGWINNLTFNWTLGDLTRAFCFIDPAVSTADGFTISNIEVDVVSSQLYLLWKTLPKGVTLPMDGIIYDYNQIDVYTQVLRNDIAVDGLLPVNFNSTNFRAVPSDIIAFCSKTWNRKTTYDADAYQPIVQQSVSYANYFNQLSNNARIDNWRLQRENGQKNINVQQSMFLYDSTNKNHYYASSGDSVYRFSSCPSKYVFGKDIKGSDDMVVGTTNTSAFSGVFSVQNVTGGIISGNDYSLTVIAITPLKFTLSYGSPPTSAPIISQLQGNVLPLELGFADEAHQEIMGQGLQLGGAMLGGSWWKKLKKVAKSAYGEAKKLGREAQEQVRKYDKYITPALAVASPELLAEYELAKKVTGTGMLTQQQKMALVRAAKKGNRRTLR